MYVKKIYFYAMQIKSLIISFKYSSLPFYKRSIRVPLSTVLRIDKSANLIVEKYANVGYFTSRLGDLSLIESNKTFIQLKK